MTCFEYSVTWIAWKKKWIKILLLDLCCHHVLYTNSSGVCLKITHSMSHDDKAVGRAAMIITSVDICVFYTKQMELNIHAAHVAVVCRRSDPPVCGAVCAPHLAGLGRSAGQSSWCDLLCVISSALCTLSIIQSGHRRQKTRAFSVSSPQDC